MENRNHPHISDSTMRGEAHSEQRKTMVAQEIEQQVRNIFGIPQELDLKWVVICETKSTDGDMLLPGIRVADSPLVLDIYGRRFVTECKVLGFQRMVLDAEWTSDDYEVVVSPIDGYQPVHLPKWEFNDIYAHCYFSAELLEHAKTQSIL